MDQRYAAVGGGLAVILIAFVVLQSTGTQSTQPELEDWTGEVVSQDPTLTAPVPTVNQTGQDGSGTPDPSTLGWADLETGGAFVPDKTFVINGSADIGEQLADVNYTYSPWTVRGLWKVAPEETIASDTGTSLILTIYEPSATSFTSAVTQNIQINRSGEYQVAFGGYNPAYDIQSNVIGCVDIGARLSITDTATGEVIASNNVTVTSDPIRETLPTQLEPGTYEFGVTAFGIDDGCGLPHHELLLIDHLSLRTAG